MVGNNVLFEGDFCETERNIPLYAKVPEKYETLPDFPEIEGLQRWDQDEITDHFRCGDLDMLYMNGELDCMICNKCYEEINGEHYYVDHWSSKSETDSISDFYLCVDCGEKHGDIITKYDMVKVEQFNNGLGSIFDWIPIYRDVEYNSIFYCAVKGNQYFGKYAMMSVDNHGRLGMHTFEETLPELIKEFGDCLRNWKQTYGDTIVSWEKTYNVPIKQMMYSRNYQYHYG